MTLKVVVLCRETIKPSLPTPQHLRDFKLSHIDQYIPPLHVPIILFYPANEGDVENAKAFTRLKVSLSEALTRFYPLGGRIHDNHLLECNDNGVEYIETHVSCELKQIVCSPKDEDLFQLIFCDLCSASVGSVPLLSIQVNRFRCGGIAIAACVSHKIADAASLCTFVNGWAKTACGCSENIVFPTFDASTIFPPGHVASLVELPTGSQMNKVVSRRFIFESSNISSLKGKVANASYVENPTRVEAIVALIWRCAMKVSGFRKPSQVNLGVNVRAKLTPPLPDHSFGNLLMAAITSPSSENDNNLQSLVENLREGKRKLTEDYLKNLPVNDVLELCHQSALEALVQHAKGEAEFYTFASWCRFPFYEADFGWGEPIWATCVNLNFKNAVILMDTRSGDGIEAWVNLDEQEMARFECDEELLAYASRVQ